ncbi:MAG: FKBP-type peptidyl-prolyl cis-trans isomerase [Bacteroidales bacterium]
MKLKISIVVLAFVGLAAASCQNGGGFSSSAKIETQLDSVSYFLGIDVGNNMARNGMDEINTAAFVKGLEEALGGSEMEIDQQQMQEVIGAYFKGLNEAKTAKNLQEGREFLEENKTRDDVQVTESGLQYEVLEEGTGVSPTAKDTVSVLYKGTLVDGTVFDENQNADNPARFHLGRVIPGWVEGLQLMKEGAKYRFYLPTELAYGTNVRPGGPIEPNMALIFDVELLKVTRGE